MGEMMLEYLNFVIILMVHHWLRVQGFGNSLTNVRFQKYDPTDLIYGNLTEVIGVKTLMWCIVHCKTEPACKGAVFSPNTGKTIKCRVVKSGIYFINMTGYEYYSIKRCTDPDLANYEFLLDVGLPCPRLYFPLNEDTGTKHGSVPGNAQFVSGGKVGGAFLNNITSSERSFYNLGYYRSSEFCFPLAESCPLGITVAFWLKILGDLDGNDQGIFTTRTGVFLYNSL